MGTNIVLLDNWLIVFSACKSNILGSINGVLFVGKKGIYLTCSRYNSNDYQMNISEK